MKFNLDNKKFALISNSEKGTVNSETIFHYKQIGRVVHADYSGGSIVNGKIFALMKGEQLEMIYQCITTDHELKAGKAHAKIELNEKGKVLLKLNWQWMQGEGTGQSEYIEI